jgi:SAM-dependent methyltransferase
VDDRRIYDAYLAGRQSAALAVAVRIGLFELLDAEPLDPDEIARRLELRVRAVRALCRALAATGLLERRGERLGLAPDAAAWLVRGRPGWLGGLIDLEVESFLSPALLLEALHDDAAPIYGGEDPWERHARDPEAARRFTRAMHSISERPAAALARVLELADARTLLDVGGGSGALSIALARAWPALHCSVWELPTVCEVALEYTEAAGLSERVRPLPGDFLRDPFPGPQDVVLFSQILHDWGPPRCRELVRAAFEALVPGGRVLVHEKLTGEREPLANALVDLDMLVWTEGQQWDEAGLRALLADVGFECVERRATTGYWSVISARRPR